MTKRRHNWRPEDEVAQDLGVTVTDLRRAVAAGTLTGHFDSETDGLRFKPVDVARYRSWLERQEADAARRTPDVGAAPPPPAEKDDPAPVKVCPSCLVPIRDGRCNCTARHYARGDR